MSSEQDAAATAHRGYKFLLVYLHAGEHDATARFCRETLCDAEVVDHIGQHYVAWGGDVRRSDAFRVCPMPLIHACMPLKNNIEVGLTLRLSAGWLELCRGHLA